MISRDIAVVDWQPDHWIRMVRGPQGSGGDASGGWLVLICDDGDRIVHAVLRGAPRPDLVGQPVGDLAARRREHGAARVVCLEQGALRRILARGEGRLDFQMDYVQQVLTLVEAFRSERGAGLRLEPSSPPGPLPPFAWLQFLFDRLWPDDTAIILHVVDEARGELWTSLLLRKRAGDLDLLTTDLHLGDEGLRAGSWRADRTRMLGAVARRVARPFLAATFTLDGWRAWRQGEQGVAALRRTGQLELDPLPRRFAVPLHLVGALSRLRPR